VPGFCKSASLEEIKKREGILTPGSYVESYNKDDNESSNEKINHLVKQLDIQLEESRRLEKTIRENMKVLGYGY
jgi:type I restriction enzyme M protein